MMGLPDWSGAKIRLVMLAVAMPVMLIMVAVGYATEDSEEPSADCQRADQIAHQWVNVVPGVLQGMGVGEVDPNLARDAGEAATAVRDEAASIEDHDLKRQALRFADALQRISEGNPRMPPSGWPDKNFVGGFQDGTDALHELKVACPNVGTDELPAGVRTSAP
ncbi:hypothetical protein A5731_24650 [Mycolicibacterium conceptionense]|uniref:Uncharacterized protein n=2 Tax=Mycobacteriaceae TaxID=1762 RepID=A0A0U1DN24_9MYCO|nr:hypothetical protein A5718_16175 [Mycolicibacterium conceptionense]OBE96663.1 hypothetical protein A5731_24650 [Mycolicibacterium conceptionense]OBF26195.1 hypothetical protein A5726_05860 [Mycolicibacterium conceptionense]OBF37528.1 hypothetical protein A5720_19475 [Mycolicibacterium conceptionense]OBH94214.1 hypothetical protein A5716_25685 [Mycolicibacterium conceptionense]